METKTIKDTGKAGGREQTTEIKNKITVTYFGHIKRHSTIVKTILEGRIGHIKRHNTIVKTILEGKI